MGTQGRAAPAAEVEREDPAQVQEALKAPDAQEALRTLLEGGFSAVSLREQLSGTESGGVVAILEQAGHTRGKLKAAFAKIEADDK